MKKVGLVSVRNYNYGSILQAYALQRNYATVRLPSPQHSAILKQL